MKTNQEVVANLRRAKEIFQTRGRAVGTLINGVGECCPLGAVGLAVVGDKLIQEMKFTSVYDHFMPEGDAYQEVQALDRSIPREVMDRTHEPLTNVYRFNDRYANDQMIMELFNRAIESLS
jgi:hypothetical protein